MKHMDLQYMSIAEAGALIRDKELSPVEYVKALIERAEAINPLLDAYVLATPEEALRHYTSLVHEM